VNINRGLAGSSVCSIVELEGDVGVVIANSRGKLAVEMTKEGTCRELEHMIYN
jgi:hypothetical protein